MRRLILALTLSLLPIGAVHAAGAAEHASHRRDGGFAVTVEPTGVLAAVSRQASGHVPVSTANRPLREWTGIKGVMLSGMIGTRAVPLAIHEISEGALKVHANE